VMTYGTATACESQHLGGAGSYEARKDAYGRAPRRPKHKAI
jgi:hypothetical protein